jgi:hypothetical protein
MQFGFLGLYNRDLGISPFERFYIGGDGLSGFGLDGREIVALRGYDNNSLSASFGGTIFTKYGAEVRYRLSPNLFSLKNPQGSGCGSSSPCSAFLVWIMAGGLMTCREDRTWPQDNSTSRSDNNSKTLST